MPENRWGWDADGWLCRPATTLETDQPPGARIDPSGCNAFIEGGLLYCRNEQQAARLDRGLPPE